jgi:hypothetical protein
MSKKKETKVEETMTVPNVPETMEVRFTESYSTFVSREAITITIADYPELAGMTEDEIKDYITSNAEEMSSPYEWADNLYEALSQMDVIREKITDEDSEVVVD